MLITNIKELDQLGEIQAQLKIIHAFVTRWQREPWKFTEKKLNEQVLVRYLKYETDTFTNRSWEAHRKEIDFHLMLQGTERIYLKDSQELTASEYHEENDYYLLQGASNHFITLNSGTDKENMLLLWTDEAHKTGVKTDIKSETVEKMVFKIKLR
ncbi:YhcH/YjgK/YiaL family protein [Enterococcus montenegrensis]|uniref:YhcH/YjgK/YiaL family protein n=1 Tax=Enterococcus TaxID=1350 RepID=UPI001E3DBBF3|nr:MULTISPECIES: YhcH/YjgK/YiaL family protein [Enterococcus]MCD1025406.1 YhcH/YjgK/YiaL family protein [Enterococcus sp. SMC-9]WHA09446.1 YhcH/YjgK/YiaL family protein [Enterococcus montenegrensis]